MDNYTFKIYKKMFPGNNSVLPSIDAIDLIAFRTEAETETVLNTLIHDKAVDIENVDINDFLKLFKKVHYEIAREFINDAIDYYFSHPQVLAALQDEKTTLFPNYRSLPDIDYDLLIPVMELDS